MKETVLTISGKPGLYKLISKAKNLVVVEILDSTKKRMPVFPTDSVSNLNDISMYTEVDDVPLTSVLKSIREKEEGKPVSIKYKKSSSKELREYFLGILPNFDKDRIHDSDIKKLLQWYDILIAYGITDFEEEEEEKGL